MARLARIVVPEFPHHIIQRGNRRQKVFFQEDDYRKYLQILESNSYKYGLKILSYCLMPNHVHLIVIPTSMDSLTKSIGGTHYNYTKLINKREGWNGYLWQGRFKSYVLNERYLYAVARYILLNPVKANIVREYADYRWSSIRHHLGFERIKFIQDDILQNMINNWSDFMDEEVKKEDIDLIVKHENTGRPLGEESFIEKLENELGRSIKKKKTGPKSVSN